MVWRTVPKAQVIIEFCSKAPLESRDKKENLDMETERKYKVFLCHDHFERLVKDNVCQSCPSRLENREAVLALAALNEGDGKMSEAILVELQLLRRGQEDTKKTVSESTDRLTSLENTCKSMRTGLDRASAKLSDLREDIHGDGNGKEGLRLKLRLLEENTSNRWSSIMQLAPIVLSTISIVSAIIIGIMSVS